MIRTNLGRLAGILGSTAILIATTTQASAHAELVSAEPAADEIVATPDLIVLHFSEEIELRLSSLEVASDHGHSVAVTTTDASDEKSLAAIPNEPLVPGTYTVNWITAGDDGHRINGTFSFTVE